MGNGKDNYLKFLKKTPVSRVLHGGDNGFGQGLHDDLNARFGGQAIFNVKFQQNLSTV